MNTGEMDTSTAVAQLSGWEETSVLKCGPVIDKNKKTETLVYRVTQTGECYVYRRRLGVLAVVNVQGPYEYDEIKKRFDT